MTPSAIIGDRQPDEDPGKQLVATPEPLMAVHLSKRPSVLPEPPELLRYNLKSQ